MNDQSKGNDESFRRQTTGAKRGPVDGDGKPATLSAARPSASTRPDGIGRDRAIKIGGEGFASPMVPRDPIATELDSRTLHKQAPPAGKKPF